MSSATQTIKTSDIDDLPVFGRVVSKIRIKESIATVRNQSKLIKHISVGRIGEKIYPINDFETVMGFRSAGVTKIPVVITDYKDMKDLLAVHIHENLKPFGIDPLKIRMVANYLMKQNKMNVDAVCKVLPLDTRPDLRHVLQLNITDDATNVLLEMLDEISENIHHFITPLYYLKHLAKIKHEDQTRAAIEIKSNTIPRMKSDGRYEWMVEENIKRILNPYDRTKNIPPTEKRVAQSGSVEDLGKKRKSEDKESDKKTITKASKYIAEDPNLIYVPIEGEHPDLLVNKKTGRIAKTKESAGTYTVTDDIGKSTYLLPEGVIKHLGLHDIKPDSLCIVKFASIEKAQTVLAKVKDTQLQMRHNINWTNTS